MVRRHPMTPARRARIFEAHDGGCGVCHRVIEGDYEIDHAIPLALGADDDDGGNIQPVHPECHRAKTYGSFRTRSDVRAIAKAKRLEVRRLGGRRSRSRSLTHPYLVRSVDGTVSRRDGTEGKMR